MTFSEAYVCGRFEQQLKYSNVTKVTRPNIRVSGKQLTCWLQLYHKV